MVFKTTAWATITRRSQSQCLFTTLHWRYRDRPVTNQFKIFRRVLRFEEHYPFYSSRLNFASTFTYDNMAPQSTTKELAMKLKKRWLALFQEQPNIEEPLPPDSVLDWWDYIETHYSESTRHYHTLQHLDSLLGLLDLHISELQSPQAVTLAVFFHDVIYDPKASDNEEKSAEAFKRFSEERLGPRPGDADLIRDVYDWILQTKGHLTPYHQDSDSFGTQDLHFFLDFDMQVLGWPEEEYFAYASQIRKEYIHYPESEYRSGRAQVLRTFLKRPRIYATELFHKQFEIQARRNIEEEIKRLEAG